jgi:hypothetical protein
VLIGIEAGRLTVGAVLNTRGPKSVVGAVDITVLAVNKPTTLLTVVLTGGLFAPVLRLVAVSILAASIAPLTRIVFGLTVKVGLVGDLMFGALSALDTLILACPDAGVKIGAAAVPPRTDAVLTKNLVLTGLSPLPNTVLMLAVASISAVGSIAKFWSVALSSPLQRIVSLRLAGCGAIWKSL